MDNENCGQRREKLGPEQLLALSVHRLRGLSELQRRSEQVAPGDHMKRRAHECGASSGPTFKMSPALTFWSRGGKLNLAQKRGTHPGGEGGGGEICASRLQPKG